MDSWIDQRPPAPAPGGPPTAPGGMAATTPGGMAGTTTPGGRAAITPGMTAPGGGIAILGGAATTPGLGTVTCTGSSVSSTLTWENSPLSAFAMSTGFSPHSFAMRIAARAHGSCVPELFVRPMMGRLAVATPPASAFGAGGMGFGLLADGFWPPRSCSSITCT